MFKNLSSTSFIYFFEFMWISPSRVFFFYIYLWYIGRCSKSSTLLFSYWRNSEKLKKSEGFFPRLLLTFQFSFVEFSLFLRLSPSSSSFFLFIYKILCPSLNFLFSFYLLLGFLVSWVRYNKDISLKKIKKLMKKFLIIT